MADGDAEIAFGEAKEAMEKAIRSLRAEIQKVRTGRANASLLENIQVDYFGAATPLNQLANMTVPDARLIVISPFDKSVLQAVEKAILTSDLGLSPNNDGKVIRIPIPPLTEERRKELVKHIGRIAEDHKVGVRDARREALSMLKDLESRGDISKDDRHGEEKNIQRLTDEHVKKIDEMIAQKEEEILHV